jgi:hypothetical protein
MTNQQFLKNSAFVLLSLCAQTIKTVSKSDSYEDLKQEFTSQKSDHHKKRFILEIISNSYSKKII